VPRLARSCSAWGTPAFEAVLREELAALPADAFPLQQGLSAGSHALGTPVQAMIKNVSGDAGAIRVRAGIFYSAIIAGCSCADDPTPVSELPEYCEVQVSIDRQTGEAAIVLVAD
jgi:hypothetical protein